MNIICPHCTQALELDQETLAALRDFSHFECPVCTGQIPVPRFPSHRPVAPLQIPQSHGKNTSKFSSANVKKQSSRVHRGMNRNLLILGSLALLLLGGLGIVIASRKSGDVHNTKQAISNEFIHNKFFTDLITSGATTEKDLEAVTGIRANGEDFVGVSREKVTWKEARELALNTGSEILEFGERVGGEGTDLSGSLEDAFPEALTETCWVSEHGGPKMIDIPDLLRVTTLERPRRVLLRWQPWNAYVKNRDWFRLENTDPQLPHTFDADKGEWLHVGIRYNNTGPGSLRVSPKPYSGGKIAEGYGTVGMRPIMVGSGEVEFEMFLTRAGEIDEVLLETFAADGPTKTTDIIATTRIPLKPAAIWSSSQDVELVSVKAPANLSAAKEVIIPAAAGGKFTVNLTARYKTLVPTKLASNLLLKDANILPPSSSRT